MNRLYCFFVFFMGCVALWGQQATVQFKIAGLKSPVAMVGYFQGGKAYRLDSLPVDTTLGTFQWQKKGLQPGVYFCSIASGKLFDFLIFNGDDNLHIGWDMEHPDSCWSINSRDLETYFRFEQGRKKLERAFEAKKAMRAMVTQATRNDPEALKPIDAELNALVQKTDSLALDFVRLHPEHLFARMLYAVRPPEPPKQVPPTLKNGEPNPAFLRWVRDHYWDHTDFKAEELLNNSFWHIYFDNFFSRHVVLQPDSIMRAVDNILYKTPKNGAFYRFITLRITQYYEQKEAPGADRIFVHMVDRFLKKQETPWLDAATLERLWYKADLHRPNLTGSLAVNFSMPDEIGTPVDLYSITAPLTVLIFYSPLCEHCMESMPKLYQVFLDFKPKGLAVLAINTDTETEYWRKFVFQQHWEWTDVSDVKTMEQLDKQYAVSNLPLIYVLDKDKKILAKRLRPADLGGVLQSNFDKISKK